MMVDVACALITLQNGKILVTQRSAQMRLPLKREFPGGKVEADESAAQYIVREIAEELGLEVEISNW
jgi:8-oxo-dGTP diphosphatase